MENKEYMPCSNCDDIIEIKPIMEGGEIDGINSNDLAGYCKNCRKYCEFSFQELEDYEKNIKEDK